MNVAKIFKTGRSQAVRLPKEYRFKGRQVVVKKMYDMVILYPRGKGWDLLAKGIQHFTDDFMAERDQPPSDHGREGL